MFAFLASFLVRILLGITFEGDKFAHQVLVHVHNRRVVVKISAVILGAENCHQLFVFAEKPVTIFHDLVPTAN